MYFRDSVRRYKNREYHSVQLVECFRHPETRRPTTKVLASLGDLTDLTGADRLSMVQSLARALGVLDLVGLSSDELALAELGDADAKARSIGSMWAILGIMQQLTLPEMWEQLVSGRKNSQSLSRHLTALLCNRLDDPRSKLGILSWLETVLIPGIDTDDVTYQGLLRTMDALIEHKDEIEKRLADRLLTLFDTELDLVLMDVTSVSVSSRSEDHPLFAHGYSRDGHPERKQYVLMMVTTKDGIPIYHDIHPGSTADLTLVDATMKRVRSMFGGIDRCMVVGDRGMLSKGNLEALTELGFQHLVALPLKRESGTRDLIKKTHEELLEEARKAEARAKDDDTIEVVTEVPADDGRYVVAFSKKVANTQRKGRDRKLDAFDDKAAIIEARLQGKTQSRGRQLTDHGAFKQLVKESITRNVAAYFRVEMRGDFLWVEPIDEAIEYAEECDGKLALHTNSVDFKAEELYRMYKDLQEIERSFRALKHHIAIRPTYHWTEERVRAHVFVCVLALVIERVMRLQLKRAKSTFSPAKALDELRKLTHVQLSFGGKQQDRQILANKAPVQLDIFDALNVERFTDARLKKLTA
jgi:transposase